MEKAQELRIPLGCFSESALEMRNKERHIGGLGFARKTFRIDNIQDMFNFVMYSSDPYVNSLKI